MSPAKRTQLQLRLQLQKQSELVSYRHWKQEVAREVEVSVVGKVSAVAVILN